MMTQNKKIILPDFQDLRILVIGDIMIDRYVSGDVKRISPEAPVPVVELQAIENRLGGAANVALNLCALGSKVTLISIIGDDEDGKNLSSMLNEVLNIENYLVEIPNRKTTVKTRVMSGNQHLLRIDKEDTHPINFEDVNNILDKLERIFLSEKIDGIILQDYNKGLLTESLIRQTIAYAQKYNIATFIDPKEKNFFAYEDCTLFKPNKKEVQRAIGNKNYKEIDMELRKKLNHKITMITLGNQGIYISDGKNEQLVPTESRVIADVCGAGDSVISIVSLCYLKGLPIELIAIIANKAGGQVCEYPGVVALNLDLLKSELIQN